MPIQHIASLDITVVQKGDSYIVSGKDAASLHAKMMGLPGDAQTLLVGPMEDGQFSLRKMAIAEAEKKAASG